MDGNSVAVNVAVVGVGADDAATRTAAERLAAAGHEIVDSKQLAAGAPLLEVLTDWIEDERIDVVIAIAHDTEPVRAAMAPMVSRAIPGFGELLRAAAFSEIGSAAMLLDGDAARCGATYVFVLPGTVGAVKVAMDHLLLPQLDTRTRPLNLAARLPRLRGRTLPMELNRREDTDPGTPPPPKNPTPAPRVKTLPPPGVDKAPSKTPPLGVVLRATPVEPDAAKDAELLTSDAAILIPPAVIVEPPAELEPPAQIVDKPPVAETAVASDKDTVAADQLGAFVMSLEKHAAQVRREKSQVGPLPTAPAATEPAQARTRPTTPPPRAKTQPPPVKRTDAEMKALRDASVAEAISKVEQLPEKPAHHDEPAAPRKKNETTPQQWAQAAEKLEKLSPRAARDPGSLGASSAVLGQGDRVIVIPQHQKRRAWLFVPLALVVGAGGAFVLKTQFLSGNRTAAAEPQPDRIEQTVKVEPAEPAPAPPPSPAAAPAEPSDQPRPLPPAVPEVAEIEMEPGAANLTALAQAHADHHGTHAVAAPPPSTAAPAAAGSAAGSGDDAPDPHTHPNIAPASPDCDEASCILEHYARECCARYKPAEMPAEKIEPQGPPETLDKNAVKTGIADVKPAVQQCGEDHYAKGTVKITLTVSADGVVTDATVSETPAPELGTCVASALRRATFGKTKNGAVFTYPFMF